MSLNNNVEIEGTDSMPRPQLSVVPDTPEQPVVTPFERSHFSEGAIAVRIGAVATDLKLIYQKVATKDPEAPGAKPQPVDYDTERRNKRKEMAIKLFQEFEMLSDVAVTDFSELYSEAEAAVTIEDPPREVRTKLLETVEMFEEHPVIRAAMALARTSSDGAIKKDVVTIQRASAMILEDIEQPGDWKPEPS